MLKARLRRGMRLDAAGQASLKLLEHELVRPPKDGLRERFIDPVRNDWAFHYLDHVYRAALAQAEQFGGIIVAGVRGFSRFTITDDFQTRGLLNASGRPEGYGADVRDVVRLAGALGQVVDAMVVELLYVPGRAFKRVDLSLTRLVATEGGNDAPRP